MTSDPETVTKCGKIDWEQNEGDRCRAMIEKPEITTAMLAPGARCGHHGNLLHGEPCPHCFPSASKVVTLDVEGREMTETRRKYEEAREHLLAVARTYQRVPEANAELEALAVEKLKEAAVDFTHAEREAWEAGLLEPT